jgi:hypothetical protein
MTKFASVAEVQHAGVTIEAEEAVAIAQRLLDTLRSGTDAPGEGPFGPPTTATVYLSDDGSVVCRGCEATPAVSEIAILLQAMLPRTTRIPGGLRYAIARALLDVDVPPYDSLDDFAETLSRYERGPRDQIVCGVLQRLDTRRALVPPLAADRRRSPQATQLRRALREADARLYLQKVATETVANTVATRRSQPSNSRAAAACVAGGLLLIAAGEFIDSRGRAAEPIVVTAPAAMAPAGAYEVRDVVSTEPSTPNLTEPGSGSSEPRGESSVAPRAPEKRRRPTRAASPVVRSPSTRERSRKTAPSRSVLERLRLNWLRNVITSL